MFRDAWFQFKIHFFSCKTTEQLFNISIKQSLDHRIYHTATKKERRKETKAKTATVKIEKVEHNFSCELASECESKQHS